MSLSYDMSFHPSLQVSSRTPIALIRDPVDRSYLETLAVDCYGTKRPEQAYAVSSRGNWIHLFTTVADVGRYTRIKMNPTRNEEEFKRKPYVFDLAVNKKQCYLHDGLNDALTVHAVLNKETGLVERAEISRGQIHVERRYLRPPKWLEQEAIGESIDDRLASEHFSLPSRVRYLSKGEGAKLIRATGTETIDEALYILNKLPHIIVGTYLDDQSVPGIFIHDSRKGRSFSEHKIGPKATTGMTAGVRRFMHRANHYQLDRLLCNAEPEDVPTFREIVKGIGFFRNAA